MRGARELLAIPVVGMTEAGLLTACMLGGRIGLITFGRRVLPLYQELVASYGLAGRIAGWRVLESTAAYARGRASPSSTARSWPPRTTSCERDFAETVILTGAVMAGVPARLQARSRRCRSSTASSAACGQAELLARLALPKPRAGSYAAPAGRELVDVDPAIARAVRRRRQ